MIHVTKIEWIVDKPILSMYGLSSDTKPLAVGGVLPKVENYTVYGGSSLLLSDGTVFKYDQEGNKWDEI